MRGNGTQSGPGAHLALFVMGGSPAILAETLAALAAEGAAPCAARVVTTRHGAALLRRRYFEEGGWRRFVGEWPECAHTVFDGSCIVTPGDMDDIAGEEDNRRMLRAILGEVRAGVAHHARVTASLAGGRKTMSYYLGLAMNLFGRAEDRLTHVIVPPEWERNRDFLIPPRGEAARIALIDTPYIRLSGLLSRKVREAGDDVLVRSAQSAIDMAARPVLHVDYNRRELCWLGQAVRLPVREFVFFRFFLEQKHRHCKHASRPDCGGCHDCHLSAADLSSPPRRDDLHDLRAIYARGPDDPELAEFRATWSEFEEFKRRLPEIRNQVNEKIERAFGFDERVRRMLVVSVRDPRGARYGLALDKRQFRIRR